MSNREYIYQLEKNKLTQMQSNLHKLLNSIEKMKRGFSKDELSKVIIINSNIDSLVCNIQDLNISLLKKRKSQGLSHYLKEEIQNYDHAESVISKFLPYMLAYSMNL